MSTDLMMSPADADAIMTRADVAIATAQAVTVVDDATYAAAGERVTGLRTLTKAIEDFFEPHVKRAYDSWKGLTAARKGVVEPVEAQVTRLGREMADYAYRKEQAQREEQARRQLAALEMERQAALAEAVALEAQGLADEAGAVLDQLMEPSVPVVVAASTPAVPKVEGLSYRDEWRHEVVDAALVPREYLMVNEPMVAKVVAATKGAVQIPGIRIFTQKVPVVRGRR